MELNYVREFLVLKEIGSYQEAAAELYISQPTLSKHIRSLEDELGAELFEHHKRSLQLTDCGRCFHKYAQEMVRIQEDFQEEARRLRRGGTEIVVGSIPPRIEYDIIRMIDEFEKENPGCTVRITEGNSRWLLEQLRKGKPKLAFVESQDRNFNRDGEYHVINVCSDQMCVLLPAAHPLACRDVVAVDSLCEENFIIQSHRPRAYKYLNLLCQRAGFVPTITCIAYRIDEIMNLITRGKGIGIAKRKTAEYYARMYPAVKLIDICPQMLVNIDLVYKKKVHLSDMEKCFVNKIRREEHMGPVTGA